MWNTRNIRWAPNLHILVILKQKHKVKSSMRAHSLRCPGRATVQIAHFHPIGYVQVLGHLAHPHWMHTR
jgi:hypothetical protein